MFKAQSGTGVAFICCHNYISGSVCLSYEVVHVVRGQVISGLYVWVFGWPHNYGNLSSGRTWLDVWNCNIVVLPRPEPWFPSIPVTDTDRMR